MHPEFQRARLDRAMTTLSELCREANLTQDESYAVLVGFTQLWASHDTDLYAWLIAEGLFEEA